MSKAFEFSLKKVLKFQNDREDIKANDLKKVKNILRTEKRHLDNLLYEKDNHLGQTKNIIKDKDDISLEKLKASSEYLVQLNNKISSQDKKVKKSDNEVQKVRKDLMEISKNRKILEKLKEKQYQNYKDSNKKEERKIESEIALRRRKRQNRIED